MQEKLFTPLGLYVHVPFCAVPCDYCAFYKELPTRSLLERYINGLMIEIQQIDDNRAFDTLYFGGGTPGILMPTHITQIAESIHKKLQKQPIEWTIELSPNTVSESKLKAWQSVGVNRISMGIQSFNAETLRTLGRKQTPKQSFIAHELIRKMGFQNVGLDLIFSIPGQTVTHIMEDLSMAISLNPEHISAYCLTYEDGTPLTNILGDRSDENRDHDHYEIVCDFLEHHGYQQYEISNFCRKGYESLHNRNTWRMGEWMGVGPSASSQYRGRRFTNIASIEHWAKGIETRHFEYTDVVTLSDQMLAADRIIFGLRMNKGVDLMDNPHVSTLNSFFQELEREGLFLRTHTQVRLTSKGRLVYDAIAAEILKILE
jgi:oxygen-independent coproporphyrinogen-3 oxidase